MQLVRQMVARVIAGELTMSGAAREYGVCRNTVTMWVRRAEGLPLIDLEEKSRRPKRSPNIIDQETCQKVLDLKDIRPTWSGEKIVAHLWPEGGAPLSSRTADRIFARSGLVNLRKPLAPVQRFEREHPNQLLQMDFKGVPKTKVEYSPLTILDDATRFCLRFIPLPDRRSETIWEVLWDVFGEFGLPDMILTDNESCFADTSRIGLSWLEARLFRLGVRMTHGRVYHPQTQGKVERLHRTFEEELGPFLLQTTIEEARNLYADAVYDYNYIRPHAANQNRPPAYRYRPSERKRPDQLPPHEPPPGAVLRRVQISGQFTFRSRKYTAGHGLVGEYVEIREETSGYGIYYAGQRFRGIQP